MVYSPSANKRNLYDRYGKAGLTAGGGGGKLHPTVNFNDMLFGPNYFKIWNKYKYINNMTTCHSVMFEPFFSSFGQEEEEDTLIMTTFSHSAIQRMFSGNSLVDKIHLQNSLVSL